MFTLIRIHSIIYSNESKSKSKFKTKIIEFEIDKQLICERLLCLMSLDRGLGGYYVLHSNAVMAFMSVPDQKFSHNYCLWFVSHKLLDKTFEVHYWSQISYYYEFNDRYLVWNRETSSLSMSILRGLQY